MTDKAKERKAKRDAGLVRVEVWVPADKEDEVRKAVAYVISPPPIPYDL